MVMIFKHLWDLGMTLCEDKMLHANRALLAELSPHKACSKPVTENIVFSNRFAQMERLPAEDVAVQHLVSV